MSELPRLQGDMDGLCGIYSILNATTYLSPRPLDDKEEEALFWALASSIKRWPHVLKTGLTVREIPKAVKTASKWLQKSRGATLECSLPFKSKKYDGDWDRFFDDLHQNIADPLTAAILGLVEPLEHWTVATEVKKQRIMLKDSMKTKHINRENAGLAGSDSRYIVDPKTTFILKRG